MTTLSMANTAEFIYGRHWLYVFSDWNEFEALAFLYAPTAHGKCILS